MELEVFKSSYGYYNLRTINGNPTEEMKKYLKQNGYYWSSNYNCWYPHSNAAKQANETFVKEFRQKFFDPATQEQKSFGQELIKREQRKAEWREAHGLTTSQEHSEEKNSVDERITYLENLVKELQEERTKDKAKIASLESELLSKVDESVIDYELEQQQIDEEAEWKKENTLTEEEEQEIIEQEEIPETTILNNSEVMNKLGEIMDAVAREEEPEAERDFSESQAKEKNVEVEVSPEELALAKSVLPTSQYVNTLRLSQGEEGNFFKQKIKDIAEVVQNAPKLYETNGAEQHTIVLRYFHPTGTETLVTEIGEDGEAFGFQCLNGDYEMAEFGYLDLNEIKNIRMMEIDYHIEKGMTVERWLYKEQPDMFPQYAKYAEQAEEKTPLDIAKETGNDVEAISESLGQQKRYYYNPYSQEYFTIAFEDNDWHYVFYDKDYNVISDDVGIIPDSPKNISEVIDTVLEMQYHIDDFDPDGMSKSEYEAARAEKERYLSKNWTIWTDVQGFEEIVELKRKAELEKENKILFLKDVLKNDEELKQSALVNNRQDFANAYYDKLTEILIKEYDNDKSDFVRNLLDSDKTKKEIMGEYIDEVYDTLRLEERRKNTNKSYDFFINDAANLDLGIGAEIEPITGLTAEQATVKYAELKDKGLSPYIGINIPGDFVFDDKEGQGAGIFTEVNGHPSFFMGDNFVKDLKEYDEHAKNVLAAYKELYEMTDKYILGVERPDFVFEKEKEFSGNKEYDFTKPINISERFAIDFVNHGYKENTVRFIDRKNNQITTGQYLVSTIADRKSNSELILDMGVSAWTVDAESMKKAEEICRYYRYNHITVTSSFEENIELEAENGERMTPEQLNQWNEEQKLQHSQDTDLDNLAEGKKFSMETAMQSVENDNKKMNFVLEKLAAAGIEVVSSKVEFERILNNQENKQKMVIENTINKYVLNFQQTENVFFKAIDDYLDNGISPKNNEFIITNTPEILVSIGIPKYEIIMTTGVINKAKNIHHLTNEEIKEAIKQIAEPLMVFDTDKEKSENQNNSVLILTDIYAANNKPIALSLNIDLQRKGFEQKYEVNEIRSIHDRTLIAKNGLNLIQEWIEKGLCKYIDDKKNAQEWSDSFRLPQATTNILTKTDIVNRTNKQNLIINNNTYGFAYEGKIYLNPALAESETAIHEYTHLWDNYTQRTNPELWQKGKDIFKNTKFWADVKADPNYSDIADNDDLLLSEVHAQICGKMADEVLNKILERDGELTRDTVIDWDKECWDYIYNSLHISVNHKMEKDGSLSFVDLKDFLAQPMKDLMNGIQITRIAEKEIETEYKIMQEISKGLTPDEISINLAKYKESLVYAQEKSKETWDDFYARNTTGFDTPQTVDEFRQAYEHNKKQFEYDVNKYTGWIKALEEVQTVAPVSISPKLTEEQKKEIYETHLKWQEFLNLTGPRIKQYGEAEMRKLSRENAKEFADEFIKAYESQDEDRLLRMNNAWGINPYTEGGFDDERDIPRTTFIKYFTDGQNISYESVKQGIIAHCKKQNIENTPVNETNTRLAANINWTEFTEDVFNKTKEDLKNWKDGEVYASINVGQLSFELVPQNMNDRMELFTNIYYPDLNATYGEDSDGVRYDTASGFDIASETFIKMSYEEFKDYFANTVLPSSLDNELTERALKPTEDWNTIWEKLNEEKTVEPEQLTSKKDIKTIREQCREILKKSDSEITESDKVILAQYEGAGGLNEVNRTNAGILNEFYTPNNLVEKVWQIVDAYAPNAKTVLEPSAGVGKFANNRPNNEFTMHELDETSARINKILHPEANVIQGAYQKQFFDEGERVRLSSYQQPKYDVVIGNPPYGKYNDKYKGLGEGKEFDRYEEYFISKGLDALKDENSIMAFVVPSGFLNTASDKQKELIASKGKLIDAYRLPVGTFPTTEVGTDIIILQSWEKDKKEIDLNNHLVGVKAHAQFTNKLLKERQEESLKILSESVWFKQHPEKILGEVKTRSNRFGKEEEYVVVHEGLTVQDELNKIDSMLPKAEQNISEKLSFENDAFEKVNVIGQEAKFRYMLLSRMVQDCKYYLGNGGRSEKHLWAMNEEAQIKDMISLYNSFTPEEGKPEWLKIEQLDKFCKELTGKTLEEHGWNKAISPADRQLSVENINNKLLRTPKTYPYINEDGTLNPDRLIEGDIIIDKEDGIPYQADMVFGNNFMRVTSISMINGNTELFEELEDKKSTSEEQRYELGQGWKEVLNARFSAPTKEQLENWKYPSWYQKHLDNQEEYESERDFIRQPVLNILEQSKNGISFNKDDITRIFAETLAKELDYLCHYNDEDFKEHISPVTNEKIKFPHPEYGYARIGHEIAEICDFYGADLVKSIIYNSVIHFSEENENDTYLRLQKEYPNIFNEQTKNLPIFESVNDIFCSKEYAGHKERGNSVWDLTREYINEVRNNSIDESYSLNKVIEANNIKLDNFNKESFQDQHSLTQTDNKEQAPKVKSPRAKKEKWNIAKSKGEVMSAQEFSRLYGRDFDEREFPIWAATDWQGNIDLSKLNADDLQYMEQSGNYICKKLSSGEPEWTHKVLFTTGDIYAKIEEQKKFLSEAEDNPVLVEMYNKNIELLEASKKNKLNMEHIHFGLKSTLAEEFIIPQYDGDGNFVNLNLQESFILWAQGHTLASRRYRNEIDFATANISREELGEELSFYDIIDYIDGKPVKADAVRGYRTYRMTEEEKKAEKAERKKEADLKRQARADVANKLFDRYLHEGLELETIKQLEEEYNRRFNSYIIPDYSKLPLFVDGMSAYKGDSKFKLYNQQIKGISFLCNKGNGLLAYDVGVGKTAAGIVATVNQIQTERSKRPLIIVPNQVYSKWYIDIKQLFPNEKVNDLYNFNKESVGKYIDPENPHKLNIPENSISLCTYEALKNITFTDESCENELYQDFANLLSADMDGSDRENAESSDKIKGIIGSASHVKDESYYFFEECGFDNLTVDEAHNFKNLWVVPRPKKKGQSNEYAGIPSGKPSARALKMYGMTQLVQQHNDNRNVFMLTATPFTNSPTEVYSMLSYIGRERLHRAGIKSLRSFFDQFAQTKQELGVTSKGEIDTKQVMKNWKELPALQSILTEFIDKVDGEEALIIRPHKFTHVKPLDMSELQLEMREMDEARMAEVKEGNSAAVIVAMNNMRLSCVAPALANPEMYEGLELPPLSQLVETSPKLKFVCDAIIDMYKGNPEKGQFMYVPLGKESHGIIKDYLVQHGIPKEAVEIINGDINNTPEKKEKITGKFNDVKDKLKIIIGGRNTAEGIDLNGNSFVMYNCSLGWNPSETIQAEGRIWRQNNMQGHVHIVYPVMNDSIDSVLYQKHDEKISRIDELWSYKGDSLNVEDINPEDLKLDLIKDPNKKAKLILEEETKDVKAELSKLNLKIKDFDEIIEKRKQLTLDFGTTEEDVQRYEKQIQDYKDRNLEVPEWIKLTLKNYKKDLEKQQYQKSNIQNKLYSWNLKTEEDEAAYIHNLNEQKKTCEEKIHNIEKSLPEILQKLVVERMEQKIMEYPVTKQREILEDDILNNLRPMKEVEFEIKTDRHNKMLAEMLKAGDITQEEHDLYKAAGYEKYEKWLNGEIESLEEKPLQEVVENDNQQSRVVEDNTSKVTDEYGFEVFGEEASDKQEEIKKAVEAIPSEQNDSEKKEKFKSATENAKKIVGANTISNDPSDLFFGFTDDDLFVKSPDNDKDELVVKSPEQLYFNFDNDDSYLTPDQLCKAEQERDKIVLPVLNDKESGMYKAFKDFSQHGIFDIVGTKIDMKETANGTRISPTGWKQLHAAMNIYRNKQFETFRYVLVDRHNGRIKDQLSVCSYMPNVCKVSDSEGKTLENVLTRAEETDCLIVAVHNHPSGNVQESNYDREATKSLEKSCLRNDGLQRFAGHIILDHDNFNIYKPHQGWKVHKDEQRLDVEDELINKDFAFTDTKIHSTGQLLNVAKSINETNNWNDNFVPVLFVNADCNISGLKYYDKSFFNKESQVIRNELQFSAIEAGAVNIFPVVTEALTNKLNGADRFLMEERMKELVLQNVFTDAVLTDSTIVEKNNLPDRSSLFNDFLKLAKPNIETTWEHKINPSLFAQMKMGTLKVIQDEELEKKPQQDLSHLKKASGMGY